MRFHPHSWCSYSCCFYFSLLLLVLFALVLGVPHSRSYCFSLLLLELLLLNFKSLWKVNFCICVMRNMIKNTY
jgi:hypothetical protein